ncbi:thiol-disulfide oxidoreductase DCC family protein [Granulicella sp. S190]|jgi:predicted DCC family thiol-disulfide oxidoreductase YuxK|uniref:thiol-disulfide oxidoreductase DCC family protein n=1 Tax=Granulicella sp. S190 TaxID=1747226 RepID=UPI00131AF151|nr:DCC1-like thiol-disulfide oxidoreductase family protein [Granulicella sp. S190]
MTAPEYAEIEGRALLLYDGVCALCNGVVKFMLAHDSAERLRFAPMQSELGREILGRFGILSFPDGVILVTDALTLKERLYRRSDAVAAALEMLPLPWRLLGQLVALVPRRLREFGYGVIAQLRYRLFGRYDICPLPPLNQRRRLLGVSE